MPQGVATGGENIISESVPLRSRAPEMSTCQTHPETLGYVAYAAHIRGRVGELEAADWARKLLTASYAVPMECVVAENLHNMLMLLALHEAI